MHFFINFSLRFSDGTRRAESAEFEERDGKQTLIVRGLYTYVDEKVSFIFSPVINEYCFRF